MIETPVSDAEQRTRALNTQASFIVQAPAGSGKTSLLIQRFLALLTQVKRPEEVVAITFTRKAAGEMRGRIFAALVGADGSRPEEPHLRTTWELANAVIARDDELSWGLALNPSRLRVMTIDSLCASLVRQMPTLSRFGASPEIVPDATVLYRRAARRVLAALERDEGVTGSLSTVLAHLDNNAPQTEDLLVRMLGRRDHWLPHVVGANRDELERTNLEAVLSACVQHALKQASDALPKHLVEELLELASHAAAHSDAASPLRGCLRMDVLPDDSVDSLAAWRGLRHLLLVGSGRVRSRVTAREGFAAPSAASDPEEKARRAELKERAAALFEQVAGLPELTRALADLDVLPPLTYRQQDWQMLDALKRLLPLAAAELKVVFQQAGNVDFTEVAHRALMALGTDDEPTGLALQLDYRIQHLLVDEFQDTSRTQYELLSRLVSGWQSGDGRTLFLVGDPMQSIYRFREADVGLFLHAREHGVGEVALEPLALRENFRSRPAVVDFCNRVFGQIFPMGESIVDSAVTFVDSAATREVSKAAGVGVHAYSGEQADTEAQIVTEIVTRTRHELPGAKIAILVRNRSHLSEILPALRRGGHLFKAVEIEKLASQSVVSDLLSLTRALLHLADRTAWLAVLRAPWCGLDLDDLFALAGGDSSLTIWELTIKKSRHKALSRDGALRLSRIKRVLADSLAEKGRRVLRRWVEGAWMALGGPACVRDETEMANAMAFFDLLEDFEDDGGGDDLAALEHAVEKLYAQPDARADDSLQVMTIHKAKGLEFDVVILPSLHRRGASDRRPLLMWLERTGADGRPEVLLAPIQETGQEDPIGKYIARVDTRRDELEQLRLLYVAATRAKERLHILSQVQTDPDGSIRKPAARSLAARLWPALGDRFGESLIDMPVGTGVTEETPGPRFLRRLPSVWMLPQAPQAKPWHSTESVFPEAVERSADWAGDAARHVGTTVHRVLQQVAQEGVDRWIGRWIDGLAHYLGRMLTMLGVAASEQDAAVGRADAAIRNSLKDERGRWILAARESAHAEMPLSGWIEGRLYNVVIDRTFVDETGTRWIIDYKTGMVDSGTVEDYVDAQYARYRGQLELYARIMRRFDTTPIRLGLYFPLVQAWREWDAG